MYELPYESYLLIIFCFFGFSWPTIIFVINFIFFDLLPLSVPLPPAAWAEAGAGMAQAVAAAGCMTLDGKLANKMWSVQPLELFAVVVESLARDPMWQLLPEVVVSSLPAVGYAKASYALPFFKRSTAGRRERSKTPLLFACVRSKWVGDDGVKRCAKVGHSCVRRVLDNCETLYSAGCRTAFPHDLQCFSRNHQGICLENLVFRCLLGR
jgi:hypothetical protein